MKCPIDGTVLQADKAEAHTGYGCISCKGSWLPKSYVASIQYTKEFDPQTFFAEVSSKAHQTTHNKCPCNCGYLRTTPEEEGVSFCSTCSGVWFEKNALKELLWRYNNKDDSFTAASSIDAIGFFATIGALFK